MINVIYVMISVSDKVENIVEKEGKILVTSIFSFFNNVLRSLLPQRSLEQDCEVKSFFFTIIDRLILWSLRTVSNRQKFSFKLDYMDLKDYKTV